MRLYGEQFEPWRTPVAHTIAYVGERHARNVRKACAPRMKQENKVVRTNLSNLVLTNQP